MWWADSMAIVIGLPTYSLEDFLQNPPENQEWADGYLVEKIQVTLRHSRIQARLAFYWRSYLLSSQQGGEMYTEAPCRTSDHWLNKV